MGIFDFFKKKPEIKKEIIHFNELDSFIKNKKEEIENKKSNFESQIRQRLSVFIKELEEKAIVLEKIDLSERRADERAKFIVRENVFGYLNNLKKLIENLKNIEEDFENPDLIGAILNKIDNFEKKSFMNYEKATFLIGKEIGAIKDSISLFLKNLNILILENQNSINPFEIIFSIESSVNDLKEINDLREDMNKLVLNNIKKLSALEEQRKKQELEIEKIKNSKEYLEELEKNREFEIKKKNFEKIIYELKQMIDFKALANVFHYDAKKMNMLNEYNSNFSDSFKKDNGIRIVKLLEEAGKNNHDIIQKINNIIEKRKELENYNISNAQSEKISSLRENINKIKQKISEIQQENAKEKKKSEKLEGNKRETLDLIKKDLLKMDVELK